MTREEIIQGLQFTVDMFLFDPTTGETFKEPRNDMDKTTIDACKGAIELLEQETCEDVISMMDLLNNLHKHFSKGFETDEWWNSTHVLQAVKDCRPELFDLNYVSPVQPKPKTGHWVLLDECSNSGYYCSECHKKLVKEGWSNTVKKINYCPNCGARMIEPQESEET